VTPTGIQRKMEMISFPTLEDRTQSEVALFRGGRHPEHDPDITCELRASLKFYSPISIGSPQSLH